MQIINIVAVEKIFYKINAFNVGKGDIQSTFPYDLLGRSIRL